MFAYANTTSAGGDATVTVNSTGNFDDGDCEGPPNDDATGNCTLAEAINVANAGDADIIAFHPPVFSKESPGVIDIEGGDGCLPDIEAEIVIESSDTGVIIDGDADDDGTPILCRGGLHVHATGNGFDFTLNGGKNFEIRDIGDDDDESSGNGIQLDGDDFDDTAYSFGEVDINGIIIRNVCQDGINISDTINLRDASLTNNDIRATYPQDPEGCSGAGGGGAVAGGSSAGDNAIDVAVRSELNSPGDELGDNNLLISDSTLVGDGHAVDVTYEEDLDGKITVDVINNSQLTGLTNDGVHLKYCSTGSGCDAGGSAINFHVNDNDKVHGQDGGIEIDVGADSGSTDIGDTIVDIQVNGNSRIDAENKAIEVDLEICCDGSDSVSTVIVEGNEDIVGEDEGVDINVDICCGDDNDSTVSVSNNESIEGQTNEGVDIDVDVGDTGDDVGGGDTDSDGNTSLIQVNGNDNIEGGGDAGVDINADLGSNTEDADDNESVIEVIGNGSIDGDDEGIDIDAKVGSNSGDSADDNSLLITISDNASIDGDDEEGIQIDSDVGVFSAEDDGDDNSTVIVIENNGPIEGGDDDGIDIDSFTGGDIPGSGGNSNSVTINGNEEIIGQSSDGGAGIDLNLVVCCDSANTNDITISGNGDIHGLDSDGIEIDVCCSVNTTTITDNTGTIRGNDGDGIDYDMDMDPRCGDCDSPLVTSVNFLTITGNDFDNSEDDGIGICCGAFEDEDLGIKSIISGNQIHHNIDDGIDIDCSYGLNIVDNDIFSNGNDRSEDAGIEINSDGCNDLTLDGEDGETLTESPSNSNRISENRIWGNVGLGIDLLGQEHKDDEVNGVGCTPLTVPVSPNDCIPFPDLETQSGNKLIGTACALCHVEIFWADNSPDDNDDHGEGAEYIITGTADDDGNFSIELPCDLEGGDLTATATDKLKNTSEFAENLVTLGTGSCATDTPPPTDTPDATATPVPPTATPEPDKVCGDVNLDGAVNAVDASLVLQLKAGMISSLANESNGDVNNSGDITSVDAALILQVSAGLIDEGALSCP